MDAMAWVGGARSPPLGPGGAVSGGAAALPVLDAITRSLEAEREQWFLWLPVVFGSGIALLSCCRASPDC
jgi:hypothetical protein